MFILILISFNLNFNSSYFPFRSAIIFISTVSEIYHVLCGAYVLA